MGTPVACCLLLAGCGLPLTPSAGESSEPSETESASPSSEESSPDTEESSAEPPEPTTESPEQSGFRVPEDCSATKDANVVSGNVSGDPTLTEEDLQEDYVTCVFADSAAGFALVLSYTDGVSLADLSGLTENLEDLSEEDLPEGESMPDIPETYTTSEVEELDGLLQSVPDEELQPLQEEGLDEAHGVRLHLPGGVVLDAVTNASEPPDEELEQLLTDAALEIQQE
ncbi:hypothetical protein [Haloactinospora alba]|nr:hypothetical protein [Haloactinospora alba]